MSESPASQTVNPILGPVHSPTTLWIGCSDARVPESVMRSSPTEQIFVHRNIANQFHLTDNNAISVLTYGVTGIEGNPIKEVRVVGHTKCAGVAACHKAVRGDNAIAPDSVLWTWLGPLRELAALHANDQESADQLAVRNVRVQVQNVKAVLGRLGRLSEVQVNGYMYDVTNGRLGPVKK